MLYQLCINSKYINSSQGKTIMTTKYIQLYYKFTLLQSFTIVFMESIWIQVENYGNDKY